MTDKLLKCPRAVACPKSFGDLTSARNALQYFQLSDGIVKLLMGDHLTALDEALGALTRSITLHHCEGN
jgi:hypothetical protein